MKKKYKYSFFKKYFTIIFMIIMFCFIVLGIALFTFVGDYWQHKNANVLVNTANSISIMVTKMVDPETMQVPNQGAKIIGDTLDLISSSNSVDAFIIDTHGNTIICKSTGYFTHADTFQCEYHKNISFNNSILAQIMTEQTYTNYTFDFHDEQSILVAVPILINEKCIGATIVLAPIENLRLFIIDILKGFLIACILSLLVAFIFIFVMTYQFVKPLKNMSNATKSYAKGDFSVRVDVVGNDEMAELAIAFNAMANSLSTTETSRRNFVANVSHELKTPMTTISGFIDGILDGTIVQEKHEYYLSIVSEEVKRLSRLVAEMLNMSKIEAGELKISPTKFDISEKIFRIFVSFEQIINKKGVEVLGFEDIKGVNVEADEDMIHQVLYNIIDNAVKFTNENGYIKVTVLADKTNVTVSIKNSGAGMEKEELSKIFERFYKVDKSRSMDVKSTGLGLYIVKNTIEMHSGTIKALSEVGKYSEFVFTIPLKFQNDEE